MSDSTPRKLDAATINEALGEIVLTDAEWVDEQQSFDDDINSPGPTTLENNQLYGSIDLPKKRGFFFYFGSLLITALIGLGLGAAIAFSIDSGSFDQLRKTLKGQ